MVEASAPAIDLRIPAQALIGTTLAIVGTCVFVVLVGLFGQFASRALVVDVIDIGHALMLAIALGGGAALTRRIAGPGAVLGGLLAGALAGAALAVLVVATEAANLRWMLVSLTPVTLHAIGYNLPLLQATALLAAGGGIAGALGALLACLPERPRQAFCGMLAGVVFAGLLHELIANLLQDFHSLDDWMFSYDGLLPTGAVLAAALGAVAFLRPGRARFARLPSAARIGVGLACLLALLALPALTNDFVAQVMMLVCLYTLMGMGLNIELGLAGLVDLGFVAFFAVGAYTLALLTATGGVAVAQLNFFVALPFSILAAAIFGFLFGLPVLKVRGDYLAIATLGLGEIIRVLVLSDMLKPLLGGAQGVVNIPKPSLFGLVLGTPTLLFYLTAAMAALAGYCAWRLQHSGLGRRWLAVREDEDVAQALGINLVQVKLSAYTLGAAFAGLAGGIFAGMVGSVFPQSFQLLVSINVLAILVVGGIGSLPGVVIGAAALIGAPEVLRDLGEYRYLIYGLVIIAVVRLKPEGLSPAAIKHREIA
ncbi:MAG TPA: branched-chain amino acid ABC transporter permease [Stellaceae bacterium]|nr:branched-chain amino acid ABC transporter permease [Stellaceae bacterium]